MFMFKGLVIKYVRGSIWGGQHKKLGKFPERGGGIKNLAPQAPKMGRAIKKMAKMGGAIKNFGAEGAGGGGGQEKKIEFQKICFPPLTYFMTIPLLKHNNTPNIN